MGRRVSSTYAKQNFFKIQPFRRPVVTLFACSKGAILLSTCSLFRECSKRHIGFSVIFNPSYLVGFNSEHLLMGNGVE